jgi:beta-D-xylosidase 4
MYSSHHYLALLWATGAYALFPDCTNGPLKNETICNPSACMFKILEV